MAKEQISLGTYRQRHFFHTLLPRLKIAKSANYVFQVPVIIVSKRYELL